MTFSLTIPKILRVGVILLVVAQSTIAAHAANSSSSDAATKPLLDPSASVVSLKSKIFRSLAEKAQKPTQVISAAPWAKGHSWTLTQHAKAPNNAARYLLIGQHLKLADECLQSGDDARAFQGVAIANLSVRCCLMRLKDTQTAIDICDAYLVPQWQWAERDPPLYPGPEDVLQTMIHAYRAGKATDKAIEACRLLITIAKKTNIADVARLNLAQMLAAEKRWKEAVACVKEISPNGSVSGARKLLPEYEKQLKAQISPSTPTKK